LKIQGGEGLSSVKPKSKSSVKAAIGAVREFIGGHPEDEASSVTETISQRTEVAAPEIESEPIRVEPEMSPKE